MSAEQRIDDIDQRILEIVRQLHQTLELVSSQHAHVTALQKYLSHTPGWNGEHFAMLLETDSNEDDVRHKEILKLQSSVRKLLESIERQ